MRQILEQERVHPDRSPRKEVGRSTQPTQRINAAVQLLPLVLSYFRWLLAVQQIRAVFEEKNGAELRPKKCAVVAAEVTFAV